MNLRTLYTSTHKRLRTDLEASRDSLSHGPAKGSASETNWLRMLQEHLPHRYRADQAFIIDSNGKRSQQIDVVIFDRQYTPVLFNHADEKYIPAESVYAVFEVKQKINASSLKYAGEKAASVRRLKRTSAKITHAGGTHKPRKPFPILTGILAYESNRSYSGEDALKGALEKLVPKARLDFGCTATVGAFEVKSWTNGVPEIVLGTSETALSWFLLRLLARLQGLGTVTAIQYDRYLAPISRH